MILKSNIRLRGLMRISLGILTRPQLILMCALADSRIVYGINKKIFKTKGGRPGKKAAAREIYNELSFTGKWCKTWCNLTTFLVK